MGIAFFVLIRFNLLHHKSSIYNPTVHECPALRDKLCKKSFIVILWPGSKKKLTKPHVLQLLIWL